MTHLSENGKDKKKNIGFTHEEFEERFRSLTEDLRRKRGEFYKKRGEKRRSMNVAREIDVYMARVAASEESSRDRKLRGEGAFKRTFRLIKSLREASVRLCDHTLFPFEKRGKVYAEIFKDCYAPLYDAASRCVETTWDFLCTFAEDTLDAARGVADFAVSCKYRVGTVLHFAGDVFWDARYRVNLHRQALFQIFAVCVSLAAIAAVGVSSVTFYEYSYHGRPLGVVRNKDDVYKTIEALGTKLSEAMGVEIALDIDRDISFKTVRGAGYSPASNEDILNTITYMDSLEVAAYAVNIDGAERVIMENEDYAKRLLSSVKEDYTPVRRGVEYTDVHFDQKINITGVSTRLGNIWNFADAKRFLMTGSTSKNIEKEDMRPLVSVTAKSVETYVKPVDFGKRYINNPGMYLDEQEVISPGIPGISEVTADVTTRNGEEIERIIIGTRTVAEPVEEVIYQGTKPLPASEGTGSFIYPLDSYVLTSRFGMRWGRFHQGIDLAAPIGTKVRAADGGTVTFAGWNKIRGNYLIIDHGGLFETLYEHLSEITVKEGDKVYQGKTVALTGNTGRSLGPHLHFEVHYKGTPVDPLKYL